MSILYLFMQGNNSEFLSSLNNLQNYACLKNTYYILAHKFSKVSPINGRLSFILFCILYLQLWVMYKIVQLF